LEHIKIHKDAIFFCDDLTTEQKANLLDAILFYLNGKELECDKVTELLFIMIQTLHNRVTSGKNSKIRRKEAHLYKSKRIAFASMFKDKEKREEFILELGGKCAICGSEHFLEIDHIVPLSKGGSNERSNFQVLCKKCNCSKGSSL